MKKSNVYLKGVKDSYINVISFLPNENIQAILHISHGMGEHAARYEEFAAFLTEHGIAVYAHDHRGHGKSLKPNQDVGILKKEDTFVNIVGDVDVVIRHIKQTHKDVPVYMLGHSMGSLILRRYLQVFHADIEKAIIMGTLPRYGSVYTKLMRLVAFLMGLFKSNSRRHEQLSKMLNDGLLKGLPHQTKFDWITKDEAIVKKYIDDPLCGYAYNKRFYKDFFKTIDHTNKSNEIRKTNPVPLLMISGKEDPVGNHFIAIERLHKDYEKLLPNVPITLIGVEDARHEVLNELNRKSTFQLILDWLL